MGYLVEIIYSFFHIFFQRFLFKKATFFFTCVFLAIIILSIVHIITVHAIGMSDTADVETENGVLNGPVIVGSDNSASNKQYVTFNSAASPTLIPTATTAPTATPSPTLVPTQTPTPTSVSQLILSNLAVFDKTNAKYYSFQNNIQTGSTLYGDRTYTIKSLPQAFLGSQWIRTSNNSKSWNSGTILLSFTINKQATVYIAIDKRLKKPSWMDTTWTTSGLALVDNEGASITFTIYQKTFPQGTINLGPNGGISASDMYAVIIK